MLQAARASVGIAGSDNAGSVTAQISPTGTFGTAPETKMLGGTLPESVNGTVAVNGYEPHVTLTLNAMFEIGIGRIDPVSFTMTLVTLKVRVSTTGTLTQTCGGRRGS